MKPSRTLLSLTVLLAGVLPAVAAGPTVTDPNLVVTPIVTGLNAPTAMTFLGTNDFLFVEKNTGRVRRVLNGALQPDPVLDLAVNNCAERGLVGIAVHPQFPSEPYVYLFHALSPNGTDTGCANDSPANRISRFEWVSNTLTNPLTIFEFPSYPGVLYHHGGVLAFGPDDKLYAVTGDQSQFCDLQNIACGGYDDTSVIVRLNDDGSVPADNPFYDEGGPLIRYYAYGIRNSFGMAFDPVSDTLWNTENGPDVYDEVNRVRPGFNSGWRELMGPDSRSAGSSNSLVVLPGSHYADPAFSWRDTVAPTGLAFLNSTALGAAYLNQLFVGEFNTGNLYRFELNGPRDALLLSGSLADRVADGSSELAPVVFGTGFGGISDVKVGPDGKLYVVAIRNSAIYVIDRVGRDLAVVSLKAPKKISLTSKRPARTKPVKIVIQNRGPETVTIVDAGMLENVLQLTIESLGGSCPLPAAALVPPKKGFPITLKPKKKLNIAVQVTFDCANDNLTGAGREDFRYTASVDYSALGTGADEVPANDDCPRAPSGRDKGCGGKGGADVLTDVAVRSN